MRAGREATGRTEEHLPRAVGRNDKFAACVAQRAQPKWMPTLRSFAAFASLKNFTFADASPTERNGRCRTMAFVIFLLSAFWICEGLASLMLMPVAAAPPPKPEDSDDEDDSSADDDASDAEPLSLSAGPRQASQLHAPLSRLPPTRALTVVLAAGGAVAASLFGRFPFVGAAGRPRRIAVLLLGVPVRVDAGVSEPHPVS